MTNGDPHPRIGAAFMHGPLQILGSYASMGSRDTHHFRGMEIKAGRIGSDPLAAIMGPLRL
jgi:hypothetical protein